jgi:hypothetical protein
VNLDIALWFAYIAVEAALVGLLLYRRVWQTLPVFCAYCAWDVLSNIGVYCISRFFPAGVFFHAYVAQTLLDSVFQLCVLVELVWSLLRPLRSSLPRSAIVVISVLILLAGAVIWPFASFSGLAHYNSKLWLMLTQLQHTVSILRILFFLLLAAGSQLLSISWRDRELQVVTGLGFYSLVSVAVSILQSHQSNSTQYIRLNEFVVVSFFGSLFYWAWCFSQKEAERREFTPQMANFLLAVAGAAHSSRVALTESRAGNDRKPGNS